MSRNTFCRIPFNTFIQDAACCRQHCRSSTQHPPAAPCHHASHTTLPCHATLPWSALPCSSNPRARFCPDCPLRRVIQASSAPTNPAHQPCLHIPWRPRGQWMELRWLWGDVGHGGRPHPHSHRLETKTWRLGSGMRLVPAGALGTEHSKSLKQRGVSHLAPDLHQSSQILVSLHMAHL